MSRRWYLGVRSVVDRILAVIGLVILLPVMAVIALCIALKMGRPIFFRQERVGQNGKIFKILKFRTMVANAESLGGGYFPEEMELVPPLGRVLRKTSLDELPQLVNILCGHMSIIGPRPALVDQYKRYTTRQAQRVLVPQGITGLAQVVYRNDAPWSQRIELDLKYVEGVGARMDFRILMQTIVKVFQTSGILDGQSADEVDDLGRDEQKRVENE